MAPGLLLLLLLLGASGAEEPSPACPPRTEPEPPFDALYAAGVEAHLRGDFAGAVRCLERALSAHRRLRETRLSCGLRCRREAPLLTRPGEDALLLGHGDLPFAAAVLRRASCLRSCRQDACLGSDSRHVASEEVRADFQRRVPYSYLQSAYIQLTGNLDCHSSAAAAVPPPTEALQLISSACRQLSDRQTQTLPAVSNCRPSDLQAFMRRSLN